MQRVLYLDCLNADEETNYPYEGAHHNNTINMIQFVMKFSCLSYNRSWWRFHMIFVFMWNLIRYEEQIGFLQTQLKKWHTKLYMFQLFYISTWNKKKKFEIENCNLFYFFCKEYNRNMTLTFANNNMSSKACFSSFYDSRVRAVSCNSHRITHRELCNSRTGCGLVSTTISYVTPAENGIVIFYEYGATCYRTGHSIHREEVHTTYWRLEDTWTVKKWVIGKQLL